MTITSICIYQKGQDVKGEREFCVTHLVLQTIGDAFEAQDFRADEEYLPPVSGQRRTLDILEKRQKDINVREGGKKG